MVRMPTLKDAYALSGRDAIRQLYADWADSYDIAFHAAEGYQLPHAVALAFVMAGGQGPVLDAGVGTGLVGKALHRHSNAVIDGIDLSQPMLDVAAQKGVYRDLLIHDLGDVAPPGRVGDYLGLVSAGTFTTGHAGPDDLVRLTDWLAPGALCVVSVNSLHYTAAGFASLFHATEPVFSCLSRETIRIYDDRASTSHRDDTAELLIFRRT